MRRLLFLLVLGLYGFSAMDLHEWVRVPQVLVHLLEHHSDLGHHDKGDTDHHDRPGDHNPFGRGCHEVFCACNGVVAINSDARPQVFSLLPLTTTLGVAEKSIASGAFTGGVWNPPKA
ncbi:MAG TPA: hypothetical protein VKG92_09145 [Flavobacteriales bacterium]|nr:hypothetical protein [Flavobacteriales bacterium]